MSSSGAGYDLSATTYSPDGRVFQVEYASKAVELSGTALGIKCTDGVVLGVEKPLLYKMVVPGSNRRIYTVDEHIGLCLAGLVADGRRLANVARSECKEYRNFYGTRIPGQVLNKRLSGSVHSATLYWYMRPYGCSVLLGTYDTTPQLYMIEPTGLGFRYSACAIGKGKQGATTELEKLDFETLTCRQACYEIARILYKLHDEVKDKEFEVELSWICEESGKKHRLVPNEIRDQVVGQAIEAKKQAEMEEDEEDEE